MKMAMSRKRLIELDERWDDIEQGIKKFKMILEGGPVPPFSPEEHIKLYTTIYNICTQKNDPVFWTQQLYEMYKECFDDYINSVVIPSLGDKHEEFLLRELAKRWTSHQIMVRWLRHLFHYLDRFFVVRQALPTLKEVGQRCFLDLVYEKFKLKAAEVIVTLINQEREGMVIDRALLKNAVSVYVAMGRGWMMNIMGEHVEMDYYECDFETAMLNDTAAYYSRKASDWIVEDSCPDYMLKVEECLKKEKDCVSHYLQANSETKLLRIVRNQLLVVYADQLLEKEHSGCLALLRDDKVEDLSRMCRLFREIPEGLERVANIFRQHVSSEGMVLIKQAEDAMSNKAEKKTGGSQELALVTKVIELHDKHLVSVTGCFLNNSLFHKALKEGFEAFFNKAVGGTSIAEILALYCDDILKKGGAEKLSDEAIEETLDKVVNLLAYVSDKDLFAEFHRKKLSRRLLFDRSTSDDHERLLLTKLKQQCGGQFTSKMEGMVTDLALAKDSLKHFQEYLSNNQTRLGMESTVTVITTGFWPSYKTSDLRLPAEMAKCVEVFKEFYKTKTKDRKLTWIYSLGTCNINGKFEKKTIELVVGTYQAAVLLLFNSADKLSYSDIKSQLNLGGDDLVRVLHSLSCAKYKILNKEPNTKSVSQNDHFEFNFKFTDRMKRIKIPLPPMDDRKKVVEEHVDKDRRYNIDSSIVRIMKSRKVLGFQQLVVECTEQLSSMFKPDMKQIKKRIEDLITREYLERDGTNPNSLRYLA